MKKQKIEKYELTDHWGDSEIDFFEVFSEKSMTINLFAIEWAL